MNRSIDGQQRLCQMFERQVAKYQCIDPEWAAVLRRELDAERERLAQMQKEAEDAKRGRQ